MSEGDKLGNDKLGGELDYDKLGGELDYDELGGELDYDELEKLYKDKICELLEKIENHAKLLYGATNSTMDDNILLAKKYACCMSIYCNLVNYFTNLYDSQTEEVAAIYEDAVISEALGELVKYSPEQAQSVRLIDCVEFVYIFNKLFTIFDKYIYTMTESILRVSRLEINGLFETTYKLFTDEQLDTISAANNEYSKIIYILKKNKKLLCLKNTWCGISYREMQQKKSPLWEHHDSERYNQFNKQWRSNFNAIWDSFYKAVKRQKNPVVVADIIPNLVSKLYEYISRIIMPLKQIIVIGDLVCMYRHLFSLYLFIYEQINNYLEKEIDKSILCDCTEDTNKFLSMLCEGLFNLNFFSLEEEDRKQKFSTLKISIFMTFDQCMKLLIKRLVEINGKVSCQKFYKKVIIIRNHMHLLEDNGEDKTDCARNRDNTRDNWYWSWYKEFLFEVLG